jgi:AcrR family transcriptional regulator
MPPEPQAKQTDSATVSSRDRILHSAKQLFARRGYENTSTVAIARMAGTSESQLMKHFGSKEGLLEAIFENGWSALSQSFRQILALPVLTARLRGLLDLLLEGLQRDPELKELMLLEGRRIRKEGNMVLMTSGFLELIKAIDSVLSDMQAAGELRAGVHPQAMRSAMVGMFEGLLRDQLLAQRVHYPATYSNKEISDLFDLMLSCFVVAGPPAKSHRK